MSSRPAAGVLSRIEVLPEPGRSHVLRNKSHVVASVLYDIVRKAAILDAVEDCHRPGRAGVGPASSARPRARRTS
jgi:hypothetical protein